MRNWTVAIILIIIFASLLSLSFDKDNSKYNEIIYAASDEGLAISIDGGNSWRTLALSDGVGDEYATSVFTKKGLILFGHRSGLSISMDNGKTWQNKKTFQDGLGGAGSGFGTIEAVYESENIIYAGTSTGLSISKDSGKSWINKTNENGIGLGTVYDIKVANGVIYVATLYGFSISNDQGETWRTLTHDKQSNDERIIEVPTLKSCHIKTVRINNSTIYLGTDEGVAYSKDEGLTWINISYSSEDEKKDVTSIAFLENNIFIGTRNGLQVTTDHGKSWTEITIKNGLPSNHISSMTVHKKNIYVATLDGIAISSDLGKTWGIHKTEFNIFLRNMIFDLYVDDKMSGEI